MVTKNEQKNAKTCLLYNRFKTKKQPNLSKDLKKHNFFYIFIFLTFNKLKPILNLFQKKLAKKLADKKT